MSQFHKIIEKLGRPITDLWLEIAAGMIPGVTGMNKFGMVQLAADTKNIVWDGSVPYVYPETALMTHLSQTADQAAMRGAIIQAEGLDANWNLVVQIKALDETLTTTAVAWDTPMIRCFRMKVLANVVGTSPIRCHNAAEDTDYAIIGTGNNQTLMALYTVPAGCSAYVISYSGDFVVDTAKAPDSVEFYLMAADRANGYEFQVKHEKGMVGAAIGAGGAGPWQHFFRPYYKFTEKTDIKIDALAHNDPSEVHAGFDLICIENN